MNSNLKQFLVKQSVDDVGVKLVKLEVWLVVSILVALFDLGFTVGFMSFEGFFSELVLVLGWLSILFASLIIPLQRRMKAIPYFIIGMIVFILIFVGWFVYCIVLLGQGKVLTTGGKTCMGLLFACWIGRFAAMGFSIDFALQALRVLPTNRIRNMTDFNISTSQEPQEEQETAENTEQVEVQSTTTEQKESNNLSQSQYIPPSINPPQQHESSIIL